jgi:HD-GYP domain-containing protein (c-di-GMP phosphodiesterase class II)
MSPTIAIEDLRVGMFVQLDGGWMSHPFPRSNFRIHSPEQIHTLRGLGLKRLRWVPEKSDLPAEPVPVAAVAVPTAPAAGATPAADPAPTAAGADTASQARRQALQTQRDAQLSNERRHAAAALAWRAAQDAVPQRPLDAGRASEALTRELLAQMQTSDDIGITLVAGAGDRSAAHALNVTVISLLIARNLGFAQAELQDLGVGALMHDVGKLELAERVRHVDESFGAAELGAYREHVAKGVLLGEKMALSAPAQQVLAQHHEHVDGSGFPAKASAERIGMAARVVALVNRYDNLCNPLSRSLALTPHEAVSVLFAQGRARFDGAVLNGFIRMMGVYPAGSLVQLTDDRFALVVGINASRPLKPRVLVHDKNTPRDEALFLDLEHCPNLGIRRSLPAAKLPAAAIEYLEPRARVAYFFEPLTATPEPEGPRR